MSSYTRNEPPGPAPRRSGPQLILLLVTAAVSFALGMTVGRNTAPAPPIAVRVPVKYQAPKEQLTFYKTLPNGETPALGSGINRPAPASTTAVLPPPAQPASAPQPKTVTAPPPAAAAPARDVAPPPAASGESWVLQTASFPSENDAQTLSKKLRQQGYQTFIESAPVKGKTWYRVFVGPYASSANAKAAAAKLTSQRLNAIVRKR